MSNDRAGPIAPPSDEAFVRTARAIADEFQNSLTRLALSPDDIANLAIAAMGEVVASQLGDPFKAVERMRDAADRFEAQALGGEWKTDSTS